MTNQTRRLEQAEKQVGKPDDLRAEFVRCLPDDILDTLAERRELTAEQAERARLIAAGVLAGWQGETQ